MVGAGLAWVDTHCHIADESELAVLDRAASAGIAACVVIGTDVESSVRAMRIAKKTPPGGVVWPTRFASIGLHPHDASTGTEGISRLIRESVTVLDGDRPPGSLVAVGECGLDYFYEHSSRAAQRRAFGEQIALANAHDLTLVIHTRDAWEDTFSILSDTGVPHRTILHCFSGGPEEAERFVSLGCFLSFSGIVTFKNAESIREAATVCPADRLLIETDSPYLAPVPHRGAVNEPGYVAIVGEFLAELRGEDPATFSATTVTNAARAFAARW